MVDQVVILVGGRGERLNDGFRYTPAIETPKCLVEVGGRPFVTYAINMLKGVGFKDIVLLVGYGAEEYRFLVDGLVRLETTKPDVNEAVLDIPNLDSPFLLLNGDCFPVMERLDWLYFKCVKEPVIAVKVNGRDAGIAKVSKSSIVTGNIDCSKIGDMVSSYENYIILGGLHIGTYQGLERARQFMNIVCFGQ